MQHRKAAGVDHPRYPPPWSTRSPLALAPPRPHVIYILSLWGALEDLEIL